MSKLVIFVIVFVLACIVFVPILAIWSLNTLFALSIAYSLKTWFAALILIGVVYGSGSRSNK